MPLKPTFNAGWQTNRIICMRNDWLKFIPQIDPGYEPWLHDHGSLTRRIQRRCKVFHVRNIFNGLSLAHPDEMPLLHLQRKQNIYTREVCLYADQQPVVFAHSVVAAHHLRGAWHTLQHLGSRPLGTLLFTHPLIIRAPLRFQCLHTGHPLFQKAALQLDTVPRQLWARRSVFSLYGAPLLVTEVFLPDILKLDQR
jgi:chorismate--pyruvate lyase